MVVAAFGLPRCTFCICPEVAEEIDCVDVEPASHFAKERGDGEELVNPLNGHSLNDISDDYKVGTRVLGTGASGEVLEATCRRTGKQVAVKSFQKAKMHIKDLRYMRRELEIHSSLSHPGIVEFQGQYETQDRVHVVTEQLGGGELFHRVIDMVQLPEDEAADIALQILQVLVYLHSQEICHRDIKLENILFEEEGSRRVKLIDFGFATRLDQTSKDKSSACGTLQYVAPEVVSGRGFDEKSDLWSLGCVVYTMLTGKPLFGGSPSAILKKNKEGRVDWSRRFAALPADTQEFVRSLLSINPASRPSAREALASPWLRRAATLPLQLPPTVESSAQLRAKQSAASPRRPPQSEVQTKGKAGSLVMKPDTMIEVCQRLLNVDLSGVAMGSLKHDLSAK